MRIGIFGGSFNPPHMGHINSLTTVLKKAGLDRIHVVPASQNPLKVPIEGPTPQQRLEMVRLAVESFGSQLVVDDQEIQRGGLSYTIDTLRSLRKTTEAKDLFLIIGMDNFEELPNWKEFSEIIKEANLVVTSRPGFALPHSAEDLPEAFRSLVVEFDFNFIELKTGRNIQFISLKDVEVSATEIRKRLRSKRSVEKYLPLSVEHFIREQGLYQPIGDRIGDTEKFVQFCAEELFEKKAVNVKGFDLRGLDAPSDYVLVASGTSTRHATALAESVARKVKEEYGVHPQSIEGVDEGRWVLVDYGILIVHVFYDFVRQEYNLEKLWAKAAPVALKDPSLKK